MIEQAFQKLANEYGSKYNFTEYNVAGTIGSKIPILNYALQIIHAGIPIDIKFEFGNHNLAEFNFELPLSRKMPDFEIVARDVFERLLSFKKGRWKIACNDEGFKSLLSKMLESSDINELAKKEAFEPTITGSAESGKYSVKTLYYLGFNNKEQSLKIVADFNKLLIDLIVERYG
jgi:hypothetical protein